MVIKPKVLEFSIKNRKAITKGTTEVTFNTGVSGFNFKPGQYVRLTMPTLNAGISGGNTRDFTIASAPSEKKIISIAFRNSDSKFKKAILKAPIGTKIKFQGPLGVFTLPDDPNIPIIFVAGGIGITPALSMIRFISAKKTKHNIHIVYANASPSRAVYIKEIKSITKKNSNIQITEKIGRVDVEFIKDNVKYTDKTLWYLCGVPEMTLALSESIPRVFEVSDHNIRIEEYIGYDKSKSGYKTFSPVHDEIIEITDEEVMSDKNLIDSLLDAVGQGALVAVTDVQGTIQYINNKFIEVAKYSKEELIGQNHRILKSGLHQPEFYEQLWSTISSGKRWRGEIKNRAKDGSFYWVDTTITPIFDDQKNIKQYIAVRFLISDKKDLEESGRITRSLLEDIAEEKEKMSTILQSIGDGVFVVDKELNIILFNDVCAQLTGFSEKEAVGKPYHEILRFVYEKDGKINDSFIKRTIKKGETQTMSNHTELIQKNGTHIAVADSAAPLKDSDGDIIGVVVVFRDVTKEREIDKAKNEFVSLASHQLRTPLSSINWQTGFLLEETLGKVNKDVREYLEDIHKSNLRMIDLVNSLLNTSRIDLGTFAIDPKSMDLKETAESVLKELEKKIKEKNLLLNKKYSKSLPKISADPNLMRIVFQNFLSNAVKYTPDKGKINLDIIKKNQEIIIKVQDTGMGIPKSQQEKIFTKLFRTDIVQQSGIEGTGLGLYIVKAIAEASGGKTWFESEENKGTVFYFSLPIKGMKKKKGTKGLS